MPLFPRNENCDNEETLRNLERAAEALGVSTNELAEAAIERELAAVGAGLEGRLARALDRLKTYSPSNLDRDIKEVVPYKRTEGV